MDRGLQQKIVQIEEIADDVAHCVDRWGNIEAIPITLTRAKGMLPREGEQWIIDKTVGGRWSFAAVANTQPPTITGARNANPALAQLLAALDGGGLINDETTLGAGGGGGGVTDHGDLDGLDDDDHPQYALADGSRGDFATEAQGALADSAVQPGDLGTAALADTTDFDAAGAAAAALGAATAYADGIIGAANAMVIKGTVDCSANPNYPAADAGWTYVISVAGKIGGDSGPAVEAGDVILCLDDSTASGTAAAVGAHWVIIQANLNGATIGPGTSIDGEVALFDGITGKLLKGGGVLGSAAFQASSAFATAAQGLLAASAVQPGSLGTAAYVSTTAFATAAQGVLAASAVQPTSTVTLTNKRLATRPYSITTTSTLTPEIDTYNVLSISALASALFIANHSTSTPQDGEMIRIRILDNGSARAITYDTNYVARSGITPPTTTVAGKLTELGYEWIGFLSKWNLVALTQET